MPNATLTEAIDKVAAGTDLSADEAAGVLEAIMSDDAVQIASIVPPWRAYRARNNSSKSGRDSRAPWLLRWLLSRTCIIACCEAISDSSPAGLATRR